VLGGVSLSPKTVSAYTCVPGDKHLEVKCIKRHVVYVYGFTNK
jgi:hypothetical protein